MSCLDKSGLAAAAASGAGAGGPTAKAFETNICLKKSSWEDAVAKVGINSDF